MQIKGLHKNIYKLYSYARTQECLDVYRQKYGDHVRNGKNSRQKAYQTSSAKNLSVSQERPFTEPNKS